MFQIDVFNLKCHFQGHVKAQLLRAVQTFLADTRPLTCYWKYDKIGPH